MTHYQNILTQLQNNLDILRQREADSDGSTPSNLTDQIADHQWAISLTQQALAGQLTETAWDEALQPLLVAIHSRTGEAAINQATDLHFLQCLGGSYRFIHRTIQEHFATKWLQETKRTDQP